MIRHTWFLMVFVISRNLQKLWVQVFSSEELNHGANSRAATHAKLMDCDPSGYNNGSKTTSLFQ